MTDTPATPHARREPSLDGVGSVLVVLGNDGDDRPGFMLGDARLSLGAGSDDDVYLTGVGVVPGHLKLIFLEGRMTLLSAVEEVRVDGQPVAGFPFDLTPLQVVSLGPDTHLSYGHSGSTWPVAPAWEQPQVPGEPEPAEAQTAPPSDAEDDHELSARPATRREQFVHGARLAAMGLAAATAVVVGLVVTDLAWGIGPSVVPGELAIDRSEDVLKGVLEADRKNFGTVLMTVRDDGALSLTGFVDTEEAYNKLAEQVRQQLVSSGGNVRMDVLTQGRLDALVRDTLAPFPLAGRSEVAPTEVALDVYGVKLQAETLERVKTDLSRLGARINPRKLDIQFRLEEPHVLTQEVSLALRQSAFTRDVRFEIDARGGQIVGVVPASVETEAVAEAISIQRAFESRLPIFLNLKADTKLDFNVVSITQGGNGSTATLVQRGKAQTFRVGEAVFGVGDLTDIRRDGVLLALGRREVFIPLSR